MRYDYAKAAAVAMGLVTVVTAGELTAYESSRGPTELIHWDRAKAFNGYTLIRPRGAGVFLIDMAGDVVKYWPELTGAYFMDDGTIVGSKRGADFVEVDWDGNVLWEYSETRANYHPHHDDLRIYNEALGEHTWIYIANVDMSHEEVIALGADPTRAESYDDVQMDAIVEVNRAGEVIWEWHFSDHLVQDYSPDKKNYVGEGRTIADYPGRIDINWGTPSVDYMHSNGLDYNPALGQIAISSNRFFEVYIVDHDGTFVAGDPDESMRLAASEAGDFLYRFGNPANYGQGDFPYYSDKEWFILPYAGHRQIGGNHDIQWIKEGLPGAGNLLLFNNGMSVPRSQRDRDAQSEVLEINPYLDANGIVKDHYVNPPEAGYTFIPETDAAGRQPPVTRLVSNQIVAALRPLHAFVSYHSSGVQRLPNGNSIITLTRPGRLVEMTPDEEVVWEYINPVTTEAGIVTTVVTTEHSNLFGGWAPLRFAPDHPALIGRDLSPKGPITEFMRTGESPRTDSATELRPEERY